jgi:hypothetical protein
MRVSVGPDYSNNKTTPPFTDRTRYDEIGFPGIGMQHDDASSVPMLLDGSNRNLFALCTLAQAGQKFEAFALMP